MKNEVENQGDALDTRLCGCCRGSGSPQRPWSAGHDGLDFPRLSGAVCEVPASLSRHILQKNKTIVSVQKEEGEHHRSAYQHLVDPYRRRVTQMLIELLEVQ